MAKNINVDEDKKGFCFPLIVLILCTQSLAVSRAAAFYANFKIANLLFACTGMTTVCTLSPSVWILFSLFLLLFFFF